MQIREVYIILLKVTQYLKDLHQLFNSGCQLFYVKNFKNINISQNKFNASRADTHTFGLYLHTSSICGQWLRY